MESLDLRIFLPEVKLQKIFNMYMLMYSYCYEKKLYNINLSHLSTALFGQNMTRIFSICRVDLIPLILLDNLFAKNHTRERKPCQKTLTTSPCKFFYCYLFLVNTKTKNTTRCKLWYALALDLPSLGLFLWNFL